MMTALQAKRFGSVLIALVVAASFFPEQLWGLHALAFLPPLGKFVILLLAAGLWFFPTKISINSGPIPSSVKVLVLLIVTLLMGLSYSSFPIFHDDFGDAYQYQPYLDQQVTVEREGLVAELTEISLQPSSGRRSVMALYTLTALKTGLTYRQIFCVAGVLCGCLFALTWLLFVLSSHQEKTMIVLLSAMALFAPFTQIFYGHMETYPVVFLLMLWWCLTLVIYFRKGRNKLNLVLLSTLTFLCVVVHPMGWILVPILVILWLDGLLWHDRASWILSWKGLLGVLIIPAIVTGLVLYFFIFEDHIDERTLKTALDHERLFLPLFSPDPPLDRYNMFSWNHISDFLNMVASWSLPVIFLLLMALRKIQVGSLTTSPEIKVLATVVFLMSALLFAINPLLSMPMDWDLFSIPAVPLLVLCVLLAKNLPIEELKAKLIPLGFILVLITAPVIWVNSDAKALSYRLECLGSRIFKTYHQRSSRVLISALGVHGDARQYLERKQRLLDHLQPFALVGNDDKYGNLLMDDAVYFLRTANKPNMAKSRLEEALVYDPDSKLIQELLDEANSLIRMEPIDPEKVLLDEGLKLLDQELDFNKAAGHFETAISSYPDNLEFRLFLMEALMRSGRNDGAFEQAVVLVQNKYPDQRKALRIGIHTAVASGNFGQAKTYSEEYLKVFPEDQFIVEVRTRLVEGDTASVGRMFRSE